MSTSCKRFHILEQGVSWTKVVHDIGLDMVACLLYNGGIIKIKDGLKKMEKTEKDLKILIDTCNMHYGANEWTLQHQQEGYSIRDKHHENVFGFGSKRDLYYSMRAYIKGYATARDYYEQTFIPTEEDLKEYRGY
jgi:hypothetical protein